MFKKVGIFVLFVVACAANDAAKETSIHFPNQQGYVVEQSYDGYLVPTSADEDYSLKIPVAGAVGLKTTAIAIASKLFFWILAHFWAIVVGALATFAFCKTTHICDLKYKKYPEVEQLRSLITPSRLASASEFLAKAIQKFTTGEDNLTHLNDNTL